MNNSQESYEANAGFEGRDDQFQLMQDPADPELGCLVLEPSRVTISLDQSLMTYNFLPGHRLAFAEQILALEAAERVQVKRGKIGNFGAKGTWFGDVFLGDSDLLFIARTEQTLMPDVTSVPFVRESLVLSLAAALAEKKRRESGDV